MESTLKIEVYPESEDLENGQNWDKLQIWNWEIERLWSLYPSPKKEFRFPSELSSNGEE